MFIETLCNCSESVPGLIGNSIQQWLMSQPFHTTLPHCKQSTCIFMILELLSKKTDLTEFSLKMNFKFSTGF